MRLMPFLVALAVSALLAVALPVATLGNFGTVFLAIMVVLVSAVLLVLGLIAVLWGRLAPSPRAWHRGTRLLAVGTVGAVQWLAVPVSNHVNEGHEAEARAYVEQIVPMIDHFQRERGRCPQRPQELPLPEPVPEVLRKQAFLRFADLPPEGLSRCLYYFQFRLPGSPPRVSHRYDSSTRAWTLED